MFTRVQSSIWRTVDPPFVSKPAFRSTLGPGPRGVGVGVTVGVVEGEKLMLVDETSGVDDAIDEDETVIDEEITVLLIETSGVAEELVTEILEAGCSMKRAWEKV